MPAGVLFALSAYALYSCCDAIVKGLGGTLTVYQIAFSSNLFSLIPALVATPKGENWLTFWKVKHTGLVHLRGISGVLGNLCIIYAFVTVPLTDVYSLAFLAPVFIVLLSVPFLGERVSAQRWLLLVASFVGVLIVVRPGFRDLQLGHLAALGGAICGAIGTVAIRRIAREETRTSLIGVPSAYILVFNAALMVPGFTMPSWHDLALLLAIGGLGGTASLLFIAATRRAKASEFAPVQYSQIVWAIVLGAIFYREFPDSIAVIGLGVVIVAGVLNVLLGETRIRIFSRNGPSAAGPAIITETANTP